MTRARELADLLTGGQTITTSGSGDALVIESTDAGDTFAPDIAVFRNSSSPADNDGIGLIDLRGRNDNSQDVSYAQIQTSVTDVSDGAEDGFFSVKTMVAGTLRSRMEHNSSETVFNQDSVDLDFRVEGNGNANMLFVDAGNDKVGIGTNSPANKLSVVGGDFGTLLLDNANASHGTQILFQHNGTVNTGCDIQMSDAGGMKIRTLAVEPLSFHTSASAGSPSERMRIDTSGNVLVGTTTNDIFDSSSEVGSQISDGYLAVARASTVAYFNRLTSDGEIVSFRKGGSTVGSIGIQSSGFFIDGESGHEGIRFANGAITPRENGSDSDGSSDLGATNNRFNRGYFSATVFAAGIGGISDTNTYINFAGSDIMQFFTGGSEKARISSNVTPKFFVGCTENPSSSVAGSMMSTTDAGSFTSFSSGTGAATHGVFGNANGAVGSIQTSGSSTSYNTSSDRRLKSNIEDAASASDKIDAIQVRQFDWNADDIHQDYGLIAQELQPIEPIAVTGSADSDDMMSVDYSKLVPMLIKEIQELRSRVATLEAS